MTGYKNLTDPKTEWIPVVNPEPVFNGFEEKARYEWAVATIKREPGEDINDWIERVNAAAQKRREPGEDDE